MNKQLVAYELSELKRLAEMLNSTAAQLKVAGRDLDRAQTRIEASERSLGVIQLAMAKHLGKLSQETRLEQE